MYIAIPTHRYLLAAACCELRLMKQIGISSVALMLLSIFATLGHLVRAGVDRSGAYETVQPPNQIL